MTLQCYSALSENFRSLPRSPCIQRMSTHIQIARFLLSRLPKMVSHKPTSLKKIISSEPSSDSCSCHVSELCSFAQINMLIVDESQKKYIKPILFCLTTLYLEAKIKFQSNGTVEVEHQATQSSCPNPKLNSKLHKCVNL